MQDMRGDSLVQVLQDFHAGDHVERFIGKGELLEVSPYIDASASLHSEGQAGTVGIAANGQLAAGSHLVDKVSRSASGIEDVISRADPNKVEKLEFIAMPLFTNGIACR